MKDVSTKLPGAVIVGLVLAVVLDTFVQIAWKVTISSVPLDSSLTVAAIGLLSRPLFYATMLAFGAQLWNWLRVLARADLSFVQPLTALSYITVLVFSSRWLHEHIAPTKVAGVSLILAGVYFISRTPFQTNPPDKRQHAAPASIRP
jgi:drug/metabolite transporter (DMT)-like permease